MEDRRPLVIAFLLAVVVVGAGAAYYVFRGGDDPAELETLASVDAIEPGGPGESGASEGTAEEENTAGLTSVASNAAETTDVEASGAASSRSLPGGGSDLGPEAGQAEESETAALLTPPSFDIVRVDPAGTAVIAGRGLAGATATVLANGAPVADAEIDAGGEWVIVIGEPLPAGATEIALTMAVEDGREIRSDQVVLVAIPETRDSEPLVLIGRPGAASEVLQSPFVEDETLEFAILAVDYDDAGAVIFSGRARPGARVRILANGDLVGETRANGDGEWSLSATSTLPPGRYELQADQLDEEGRVTAVMAVPFERATPEALEAVGPRTVVVQPGNSLWRMARRLYGSGWQYTTIFAANEDQIRDPNLIYPGQIFDIPEGDEEDAGG